MRTRALRISEWVISAVLLFGVAGCASEQEDPVHLQADPVSIKRSPPGPSRLQFSIATTVKFPPSAVMAGFPESATGEVDVHLESKVVSTDPLRSRTEGTIAVQLVGVPDTFNFELESHLDEEREGPPADTFSLISKLMEQAMLSAQALGSIPTSRPAK